MPPALVGWTIGYLLVMGLSVWWLFSARSWALRELAQPRSIEHWQAWRADVREQQAGPIRRRVPQSTEPPALVLMRDHFVVCLTGAVLFISLLYWVIAWFVTAIVGSRDWDRGITQNR